MGPLPNSLSNVCIVPIVGCLNNKMCNKSYTLRLCFRFINFMLFMVFITRDDDTPDLR